MVFSVNDSRLRKAQRVYLACPKNDLIFSFLSGMILRFPRENFLPTHLAFFIFPPPILLLNQNASIRLGEYAEKGVGVYADDVFTTPASLAGLPALSVPCGEDAAGLPIGVQLMGEGPVC